MPGCCALAAVAAAAICYAAAIDTPLRYYTLDFRRCDAPLMPYFRCHARLRR